MINRFYLKDYLCFDEVDLEFNKGLIVFTGPSGAGKSILMDSFLALFGIKDARAAVSETVIANKKFTNEAYDIQEGDEIIIKEIKKEKVRYFLNSQTVSKKNLHVFSKSLVKHLHLKDDSDFNSDKLLDFFDTLALKSDKEFKGIKDTYIECYKNLDELKKELKKINADESKLEELKEFAKYEIEKITSLNPKVDEYEELNNIKKTLSLKDKVEEAMSEAKGIFDYSSKVSKVLALMNKDSSSFDEAMNDVNNYFEEFNDSLFELEDLDIENVLDRIEKLSTLQKRFGSISKALEYKKEKEEELESYDNISFSKSIIEKNILKLEKEIKVHASSLTSKRESSLKLLEEKINYYLGFLYLNNAKITLEKQDLDISGEDRVDFLLNGVALDTISSGEFNRLRLALLTSISKFDIQEDGILFLDEIDANLSGKESDAIASVLKELSNSYQIFAISHQPQLTANCNQHFLVEKNDGKSTIKLLDKEGQISEISRMISGENITKEAYDFAKNLLQDK